MFSTFFFAGIFFLKLLGFGAIGGFTFGFGATGGFFVVGDATAAAHPFSIVFFNICLIRCLFLKSKPKRHVKMLSQDDITPSPTLRPIL